MELESGAANVSLIGLKLNTNKAGLEKVDKEKVNQIILEASKNSRFYENEKRKSAEIAKQVSQLVEKRKSISQSDLLFAAQEVELQMMLIEAQRDLSHFVVHVDMDAFYAAVEERDCPQLKTVPLGVGSESMLSTSNYIARQYGVRAAMPGFIARKLCPELNIVAPDFDKYRSASNLVQDVFRRFDPNFRMVSLDEAYLDLSVHMSQRDTSTEEERTVEYVDQDSGDKISKIFGRDVESAVEEMRFRVFCETKLTCSAGIAANCLLAKICSDKNKPNGQFYLSSSRDKIVDFMKTLPIRSVNGIGKVTESLLNSLGVTTCGDLYKKRNELFLMFSKSSFQYFLRVSMGIGAVPDPDDTKEERKSMSCERTFQPLSSKEDLKSVIKSLSQELSQDLTKEKLYGLNLTLKVKLTSFVVKTRAIMLPYALHDEENLYIYGCKILDRFLKDLNDKKFGVRLVGLRMAKFAKKGTVSNSKKAVANNCLIDKLVANSKSVSAKSTSKQAEVLGNRYAEDITSCDQILSSVVGEKDIVGGTEAASCSKDTSADNPLDSSLCLFDDDEDELENSNKITLPTIVEESPKLVRGVCAEIQPQMEEQNEFNFVHEMNSDELTRKQCINKGQKGPVIGHVIRSNSTTTDISPQTSSKPKNYLETNSAAEDLNEDLLVEETFCPICGQLVSANEDINAHVDNCLAIMEVRNVLKEQSGHSNAKTGNFASPEVGSRQQSKKRTRNEATKAQRSPNSSNVGKKRKNVVEKRSRNTANKSDSQASLSTFLRRK